MTGNEEELYFVREGCNVVPLVVLYCNTCIAVGHRKPFGFHAYIRPKFVGVKPKFTFLRQTLPSIFNFDGFANVII